MIRRLQALLLLLPLALGLVGLEPAGQAAAATLGAGVHADALALGPDGNLWFGGGSVSSGTENVGRVTPDGQVAEFALPKRDAAQQGVADVAAGPGGLYFTEPGAGKIAKVTLDGQITEFPLPNAGSRPGAIALGSDGALWFTEEAANAIGRITDGGVVTEFPLPPGAGPTGIAAGPDGALWISAGAGNSIVRLTTRGEVTFYPLPSPGGAPSSITVGPEGSLWFGEAGAARIGRITTSGAIEEFPVPGTGGTGGLAAGPEGVVWYLQAGLIGSISSTGAAAEPVCAPFEGVPQLGECDLPAAALAVGPEGGLWYSTAFFRCKCGGGTVLLGASKSGTVERFTPLPLKAQIGPRVSRVRGRIVKVGITCQGGVGGQSCNGRALLTARLRKAGGGLKRFGIAQRRYTLPTAASAQLQLRLSRQAMAVLRKQGKVTARIDMRAEGGERTVQKLILRPAPRRGR